jgi:hypothetical protein
MSRSIAWEREREEEEERGVGREDCGKLLH